ncbi:MAG: DUF4892 domain-containing protein [Rhabdaerophilum sp.]
MRDWLTGLLLMACALFSGEALAQNLPRDIAGSRDHPAVGRYEGSVITFYKLRDFDEMRVPTQRIRGRVLTPDNALEVKGRATRYLYRGPIGRSSLEVVRNYEQRLQAQGFETLFFCRTAECGGQDLWWTVTDQLKGTGMPPNWENQTYLAARLKRAEGDIVVAILSVEQGQEVRSMIDVIEMKGMETDKIKVIDAAALKTSLDTHGRAALYGITFEFDKADIRPESKPQLDEIVAFLKANAQVSIVVAGHTDAKGAFDYNVDLSRRRAQSVVRALTSAGIAAGRLTPFGAGMASPVASNDNDEGRAMNRRVEIVKR